MSSFIVVLWIDHPLIAQSYNNFPSIHSKQKNSLLPFQFYDKALTTINNHHLTTYSSLLDIHFNLLLIILALMLHYNGKINGL